MKRLRERVFGRARTALPTSEHRQPPSGVQDTEQAAITVNMDGLNEEGKNDLRARMVEESEFSVFEGPVEHGYSSNEVSSTDCCPRCDAPTRQLYGNFVYATQISTRAMFAPAGYFCSECPTVIVDERMIKEGITARRHWYQGVVGVDYQGKKDPDYFRTWNGKRAIHILDEHQQHRGLTTANDEDQMHGPGRARSRKNSRAGREKTKRKRKEAVAARKRLRKRK